MALTATQLLAAGSSSPGASSQATASVARTVDRLYVIYIHQITAGADPVSATVSGTGD